MWYINHNSSRNDNGHMYTRVIPDVWFIKKYILFSHPLRVHQVLHLLSFSFNFWPLRVFWQIELKPVLRNINALLSSMLSCVNEIQNFVFEMINDEWEQFKSETHRATSVKTVTDAHVSFLESITKCVNDGFVVSNTTIV